MFENNYRVGNFTSSQMSRLMGSGTRKMTDKELKEHKEKNPKSKARTIKHFDTPDSKFFTYTRQTEQERKLGRSFDLGKGSRSTAWGHLMEAWVMFDKLGFSYAHHGKKTSVHPDHPFWAGTADLVQAGVKIGDIKCYEPDNFTKLADVLQQQDVEVFKQEYTAEYWQLVSNACIHEVDRVEMVLFMPLKSELDRIREWLNNELDEMQANELHRYRYIMDASDEELPYLPDECEAYNSLETFEFEVPKADKEALTARVLLAEYTINPQL